MIGAPALVPSGDAPLPQRVAVLVRNLPQRWRERDFWVIQGAVLGVTMAHVVAELVVSRTAADLPTALHHIPVLLYLGPIGYASLRYGTEGAILTGLWSAALTIPNLLLWHRTEYEWLEVLYVMVVVTVGAVMSIPVEHEREQRRRAEATNQRLALLDHIATLTMTADLRRTLNETVRRLLDVLGLEAACVAVTDEGASGPRPTVVASAPGNSAASRTLERFAIAQSAVNGPAMGDTDGMVALPLDVDENPRSQAEGRVHGVLAAASGGDRLLTRDDHRLLVGVASHLAVAIADERLRESERTRLRSYAMLMTQAQEEERKRIARELHDEASQNVVVIGRSLAALAATFESQPVAAELDELRELAAQTVAGMRRFSRDLRPPTLDELGPSSALEQLAAEVADRSAIDVTLRVTGTPRRLPIETELAVFRIGQAALHNVERHAAATTVEMRLSFEHRGVRLELRDDGCGFEAVRDVEELAQQGKLGLLGMHERAQLVGGTLRIHSEPGQGTTVLLELPA